MRQQPDQCQRQHHLSMRWRPEVEYIVRTGHSSGRAPLLPHTSLCQGALFSPGIQCRVCSRSILHATRGTDGRPSQTGR